jgi:hypothetical protein
MGDFRFVLESVGGHGCDREALEGEPLKFKLDDPDHVRHCPDCKIKHLVDEFKRSWPGTRATLTHWPGTPEEVVDDLAEGRRIKSSFRR